MRTLTLIFTFIIPALSTLAQTWQQLDLPVNKDIISSSFISDDEGWLGLYDADATLLHTADGGASWNSIVVPGAGPGNSYISFADASTGYAVIAEKAFKTTDGGQSWTQLNLPGSVFYEPAFLNPELGYISGQGFIYKTTDGGNTWSSIPTCCNTILEKLFFIDENRGGGIELNIWGWETTDGGTTWNIAVDGGLSTEYFGYGITPSGKGVWSGSVFLEFSGLILGSGYDYDSDNVHRIRDIYCKSDEQLYAVGDDRVIWTKDGITWKEKVVGDVYDLLVIDAKYTLYAFGSDGSAFKLLNDCKNPGGYFTSNLLPSSVVLNWNEGNGAYKIHYKKTTDTAWTLEFTNENSLQLNNLQPGATYIWQVKTSCSSNPPATTQWSKKQYFSLPLKAGEAETHAADFSLYPNPASDVVNIEFTVVESCHISLELTSLSGRKIKTIAEGNFEEGNHQLNFSVEELNSGLYLLQVTSDDFLEVKKLMVQLF